MKIGEHYKVSCFMVFIIKPPSVSFFLGPSTPSWFRAWLSLALPHTCLEMNPDCSFHPFAISHLGYVFSLLLGSWLLVQGCGHDSESAPSPSLFLPYRKS